ncbi:hypothetical protein V8E54_007998 [Elaphomyces granulatus]
MTTKSDRFNEKEDYDPFQIVDRLGHKVRRITRMKTLRMNSRDSRKTTGTNLGTLVKADKSQTKRRQVLGCIWVIVYNNKNCFLEVFKARSVRWRTTKIDLETQKPDAVKAFANCDLDETSHVVNYDQQLRKLRLSQAYRQLDKLTTRFDIETAGRLPDNLMFLMIPTTRLQSADRTIAFISRLFKSLPLELTDHWHIRCDNRQTLRPADELALLTLNRYESILRQEVNENGVGTWIDKSREIVCRTKAALFSYKAPFSARTVF